MARLTAAEARSIATAMWGKINASYSTNTIGAYCFSCEGHGGFIVAKESISDATMIADFIQPHMAIRYSGPTRAVLMHHARTRGARLAYNKTENVEYYVFEEDSDYCLAVKAGINLKDKPIKIEDADATFWHWYDIKNPAVMARKDADDKRKNGDSDLIISASGAWKTKIEGVCEVITADHAVHLVTGYDTARDEYGNPWLSRCKVYEPA